MSRPRGPQYKGLQGRDLFCRQSSHLMPDVQFRCIRKLLKTQEICHSAGISPDVLCRLTDYFGRLKATVISRICSSDMPSGSKPMFFAAI